jgi:hypothetical protein
MIYFCVVCICLLYGLLTDRSVERDAFTEHECIAEHMHYTKILSQQYGAYCTDLFPVCFRHRACGFIPAEASARAAASLSSGHTRRQMPHPAPICPGSGITRTAMPALSTARSEAMASWVFLNVKRISSPLRIVTDL